MSFSIPQLMFTNIPMGLSVTPDNGSLMPTEVLCLAFSVRSLQCFLWASCFQGHGLRFIFKKPFMIILTMPSPGKESLTGSLPLQEIAPLGTNVKQREAPRFVVLNYTLHMGGRKVNMDNTNNKQKFIKFMVVKRSAKFEEDRKLIKDVLVENDRHQKHAH